MATAGVLRLVPARFLAFLLVALLGFPPLAQGLAWDSEAPMAECGPAWGAACLEQSPSATSQEDPFILLENAPSGVTLANPQLAPDWSLCEGQGQRLGYGGDEDGTSTGYHRYGVGVGDAVWPVDACTSSISDSDRDQCAQVVIDAYVKGIGLVEGAPPGRALGIAAQRMTTCGSLSDGEYEYGVGAAWLNVRRGEGIEPRTSTVGGDGLNACFDPAATSHHGADRTIYVQDAVLGGNVGFTVAADWARDASLSRRGIDENREPGFLHCGDGIIEPCPQDMQEGAPGAGWSSPAPPHLVPGTSDQIQRDLLWLTGCNPFDTVAYKAPEAIGSRVNSWVVPRPALAEFGNGGASGQLLVFIQPENQACRPTEEASMPTMGWVWTGSPPQSPPGSLFLRAHVYPCPGSGALFQVDEDRDGYGDEWYRRVKDYAHMLVDRFLDPEDNFRGDGLKNADEFRWNTTPVGPFNLNGHILFPEALDFDADHWEDGPEVRYWNDPANDPLTPDELPNGHMAVAIFDPDQSQNFDEDALTTTHDPDSDNDGWLDGDEANLWDSYPEFTDSDCSLEAQSCRTPRDTTSPQARHDASKPGTGDGLEDPQEWAEWNTIGSIAWRQNFDRDGIRSNLLDPDSDNDGLLDSTEFRCETLDARHARNACTRPHMWDTDEDGSSDGAQGEIKSGTDPLDPDTDGDGLPDGWEAKHRLDPLAPNADEDPDEDGMSNMDEYSWQCPATPCPASPVQWSGLDPTRADTDWDRLSDGLEIGSVGTSPVRYDTDYDGLGDGQEVNAFYGTQTNPLLRDTDGDRLSDYQELVTYREEAPNPLLFNTDDDGTIDNDTLNDYAEIIQYKTKPNDYDTDGDLIPDGRDERPLDYDKDPNRVRLTPDDPEGSPVQIRQDAYVIFRESGYVDVMVQDAHGAEGDILSVDVRVRLDGTVSGASGSVTLRQDAQRLDGGAVWGARIGLPPRMSQATSESFALTVVGSSGNVATYAGSASVTMNGVLWQEDHDPAAPEDWNELLVHEDRGSASSDTQGSTSFAMPDEEMGIVHADLWNLSVEELFARYGAFSIHRLKPYALPENEIALLPEDAGYATALSNFSIGIENASGGVSEAWNVTVFQNAFEFVDPSLEPGVYASHADPDGPGARGPRWLRVGALRAWDAMTSAQGWFRAEGDAQGASFAFGSDDPRAKGRLVGDIVAGFLVYGDVRDVWIGTVNHDQLKAGLGTLGVVLTFAGPEADGLFSIVKANVKVIAASGEAGKQLALYLFNKLSSRVVERAVRWDAPGAIDVLWLGVKESSWIKNHPASNIDTLRATAVLKEDTVSAFNGQLDDLALMSNALVRGKGSDVGAQLALRDFEVPTAMFPEGNGNALTRVSALVAMVDGAGEDAARAANSFHVLRNVPNAGGGTGSWINDIEGHFLSEKANGYPYLFEANALGDAKMGKYLITADGSGNKAILQLDALKQRFPGVTLKDGTPATVVIEGRCTIDGKFSVFDAKSGARLSASKYGDELEKQVALVKSQGGGFVVWAMKVERPRSLWNAARDLENDYPGVKVVFVDEATKRELIAPEFT